MAEYVQSVDSALRILAFIQSGVEFCLRAKDAENTIKHLFDKVTQMRLLLEQIRKLLKHREDHRNSGARSEEATSCDSFLKTTTESCKATLEDMQLKLGLVDENGRRNSNPTMMERLNIASKDQVSQKYVQDLGWYLLMFPTLLLLLKVVDPVPPASSVGHTSPLAFRDALSAIPDQTRENQKSILAWQQDTLHQRPSGDVKSLEDDSKSDLQSTAATAANDLENQTKLLQEVYEKYSTDPQVDTDANRENYFDHRESTFFLDSKLQITTPANRERSELPYTESNTTLKQEFENSVVYREFDQETRSTLITKNWNLAIAEREAKHYEKAEHHFSEVKKSLELCEPSEYNLTSDDLDVLHRELVFVYGKQQKWAQALAEASNFQRKLSSASQIGSAPMSTEDRLREAEHNHLIAEIHLDRYQKGYHEQEDLDDRDRDLDKVEGHGRTAFVLRKEFLDSRTTRHSDPDPAEYIQRHRECTSLLVQVYEAQSDLVKAEHFRALLRDETDHVLPGGRPRTSTTGSISLVDCESDPNPRHEQILHKVRTGDSDAMTSLIEAVRNSDRTLVGRLLSADEGHVDVNHADAEGRTALHYAITTDNLEIVHYLLECGADKDLTTSPNPEDIPLFMAVKSNQKDIVRELSDRKAQMDARNARGWSVLHHVVHTKATDMTRFLLELQLSLKDAKDLRGQSALHHCAADSGYDQLLDHAKILLEHMNADDVSIDDKSRRCPLCHVVSQPVSPERTEMVQMLLEAGANRSCSHLRSRRYWKDYESLHSSLAKG